MKKSKKLLLAGVAAMGLVGIAAGTVSTFAWYSASSTAAKAILPDAYSVTVEKGGEYGGGTVKFKVEQVSEKTTSASLLITNTAGRSYWKSGSAYGEINPSATDPFADRQGKATYKVSIVDGDGNAPDANILAGIPGTYTVNATINKLGKMSLKKTTALGAANTANNPTDDTPVTTALGVAYNESTGVTVPIMEIYISDAGAVTFKKYGTDGALPAGAASTWTTVSTAEECNPLWYGIAEKGGDAEPFTGASSSAFAEKYDCSISVAVNNGTSDLPTT